MQQALTIPAWRRRSTRRVGRRNNVFVCSSSRASRPPSVSGTGQAWVLPKGGVERGGIGKGTWNGPRRRRSVGHLSHWATSGLGEPPKNTGPISWLLPYRKTHQGAFSHNTPPLWYFLHPHTPHKTDPRSSLLRGVAQITHASKAILAHRDSRNHTPFAAHQVLPPHPPFAANTPPRTNPATHIPKHRLPETGIADMSPRPPHTPHSPHVSSLSPPF